MEPQTAKGIALVGLPVAVVIIGRTALLHGPGEHQRVGIVAVQPDGGPTTRGQAVERGTDPGNRLREEPVQIPVTVVTKQGTHTPFVRSTRAVLVLTVAHLWSTGMDRGIRIVAVRSQCSCNRVAAHGPTGTGLHVRVTKPITVPIDMPELAVHGIQFVGLAVAVVVVGRRAVLDGSREHR